MRYLVLSDIHANIDALEAVLAAAGNGYDRVLVLGDLVGYGAEPNLVIERVRGLDPLAVIRGNHDKVAAGLESAEGFNPIAQRAAAWTRATLTEDNLAYLRTLKQGPLTIDDITLICHGSPVDEDTYIFGESDVVEALITSNRLVCLFGHTHLPMAAALTADRSLELLFHGPRDQYAVTFDAAWRYLVNPGSVGQPRDGDPRASYALLDTEARTITVSRVTYPVEQASERIFSAGLPKVLGQRLTLGR
jgi:predicted phosphodiesterase